MFAAGSLEALQQRIHHHTETLAREAADPNARRSARAHHLRRHDAVPTPLVSPVRHGAVGVAYCCDAIERMRFAADRATQHPLAVAMAHCAAALAPGAREARSSAEGWVPRDVGSAAAGIAVKDVAAPVVATHAMGFMATVLDLLVGGGDAETTRADAFERFALVPPQLARHSTAAVPRKELVAAADGTLGSALHDARAKTIADAVALSDARKQRRAVEGISDTASRASAEERSTSTVLPALLRSASTRSPSLSRITASSSSADGRHTPSSRPADAEDEAAQQEQDSPPSRCDTATPTMSEAAATPNASVIVDADVQSLATETASRGDGDTATTAATTQRGTSGAFGSEVQSRQADSEAGEEEDATGDDAAAFCSKLTRAKSTAHIAFRASLDLSSCAREWVNHAAEGRAPAAAAGTSAADSSVFGRSGVKTAAEASASSKPRRRAGHHHHIDAAAAAVTLPPITRRNAAVVGELYDKFCAEVPMAEATANVVPTLLELARLDSEKAANDNDSGALLSAAARATRLRIVASVLATYRLLQCRQWLVAHFVGTAAVEQLCRVGRPAGFATVDDVALAMLVPPPEATRRSQNDDEDDAADRDAPAPSGMGRRTLQRDIRLVVESAEHREADLSRSSAAAAGDDASVYAGDSAARAYRLPLLLALVGAVRRAAAMHPMEQLVTHHDVSPDVVAPFLGPNVFATHVTGGRRVLVADAAASPALAEGSSKARLTPKRVLFAPPPVLQPHAAAFATVRAGAAGAAAAALCASSEATGLRWQQRTASRALWTNPDAPEVRREADALVRSAAAAAARVLWQAAFADDAAVALTGWLVALRDAPQIDELAAAATGDVARAMARHDVDSALFDRIGAAAADTVMRFTALHAAVLGREPGLDAFGLGAGSRAEPPSVTVADQLRLDVFERRVRERSLLQLLPSAVRAGLPAYAMASRWLLRISDDHGAAADAPGAAGVRDAADCFARLFASHRPATVAPAWVSWTLAVAPVVCATALDDAAVQPPPPTTTDDSAKAHAADGSSDAEYRRRLAAVEAAESNAALREATAQAYELTAIPRAATPPPASSEVANGSTPHRSASVSPAPSSGARAAAVSLPPAVDASAAVAVRIKLATLAQDMRVKASIRGTVPAAQRALPVDLAQLDGGAPSPSAAAEQRAPPSDALRRARERVAQRAAAVQARLRNGGEAA